LSGLLRFGAFISIWVGAVLVLAELRWFRSTSLVQRIRPHVRSGAALAPRGGVLSVESLRDLAAPLATSAAARLTRALGLRDDLADMAIIPGFARDRADEEHGRRE